MGQSLLLERRFDEAQVHLEEAQSMWLANEAANRDRLAELSRIFAELELAREQLPSAAQWVATSLEQFGYPHSDQTPGLATGLSTAARVHFLSGRPDEAEKFAVQALRVAERLARDARHSADVGEALLLLSEARIAQGDRQSAMESAQRAVVSLTNGLGPEHPLTRAALTFGRET